MRLLSRIEVAKQGDDAPPIARAIDSPCKLNATEAGIMAERLAYAAECMKTLTTDRDPVSCDMARRALLVALGMD